MDIMDIMDIALCVDRLVPSAVFDLATDYETLIRTWGDERPPPTRAELASEWLAIQAENVAADAVAAARSQMASIFDYLPPYSRAKLKGLRIGIEEMLDAGELGDAREAVEKCPTESEEEEAAKTQILNLFPTST